MREWIAFPPFIKDPAKLNKFYEDVSLLWLLSKISAILLYTSKNYDLFKVG
jgi:hypothetical protein